MDVLKGSFSMSLDTAKRVRRLKVDAPDLTNYDIYLAGVEALEAIHAAGEFETPAECNCNVPRAVGPDPAMRQRVAETLKFRRSRPSENGCPHINAIVDEVMRRLTENKEVAL